MYYFTCGILSSRGGSLPQQGYLSDLESFLVNRLLFLFNRRTRVESIFWKAPAPEQFFPRKSHRSAFKLRSRKAERFIFLPIPRNQKSIQMAWNESSKKLKSPSFSWSKCVARINTCLPEIVLLVASFWFSWLDVVEQYLIKNMHLVCFNWLLFSHLFNNDIQSKRGNQQDDFWLACINLAMRFECLKTVGF